ncbi:DUF3343 domain-containing protein [Isachenkonia alkalipeptolytica]|uniref:DUF3343 domain-containing protein n=1 Tax=Isachenkonia alkalipeptolytica TaxID=2565777 RepID=A0AA43XK51_9CLOT|nr:DUF3343 domain-containing protein [Isachenkonia alkalipeptolytica]NBG87856.1 DUF3343 domain-containing protein [Isachenkonia alkalipeptolytica]
MDNKTCIMTFHTTYHALNFEKALKEKGIEVKLIPVPRDLSSSCGSAARFNLKDREKALALAREYHIELDELYEREAEVEKPGLLERLMKKK